MDRVHCDDEPIFSGCECEACVFVGNTHVTQADGSAVPYSFYACPKMQTVLIQYGAQPEQYLSGLNVIAHIIFGGDDAKEKG